jgi:hypothetical protein
MGEEEASRVTSSTERVPAGLCPYPVQVWAAEEEGALYVTFFPPPGLTGNVPTVLGWNEEGMSRDEIIRAVGEAVVTTGLGKDPRKRARDGS